MEEIELTYLVKILPAGLKNAPKKEMLDIYIPASAEHPTLRIRNIGDRCEITKKEPIHGNDSSYQLETTIPLTAQEFSDFEKLPGKRVRKTRFYYQESGTKYEVDVFRENLAGLVLADIEFDSLEKKSKFQPPAWCLAEVTQEKFLAGGMLCGKQYADVEAQLKKFGYEKLLVDN